VARFRIRFPVHELDLPPGEAIIGRSSDCWLTLDDPLISRRHARFLALDDNIWLEDLGSRNGVRVNDRAITDRILLSDGDKIKVGSQQFLLRRVLSLEVRTRKATGFMVTCSVCGLPYGTESLSCPNCAPQLAAEVHEETTNTVTSAWSLELILETLKRAELRGRPTDVERLLLRARDELARNPDQVDRRRLDQLADLAVRFSVGQTKLEWARWALALYATHSLVPRPELGQTLGLLSEEDRTTLAPAVDEVVKSLSNDKLTDPVDRESVRSLRGLTTIRVARG
jgi:FHA domain